MEFLIVNGFLSSDATNIKAHIVQFYTYLFTESYSWRPIHDDLSF
jgi:hypothetical protein